MKKTVSFLAALWLALAQVDSATAQQYPLSGSPGQSVGSIVIMCLNGSNQAVPCGNSATPLQISGTFSTSGFQPTPAYASLTATNASARVALPSGTVAVVYNTGTTAVSCTLGNGSVVAVASEDQIQPSSWLAYTVGSNADIACIDQTGSASNVVVISGGAGLPTGAGGGGTTIAGFSTAANQATNTATTAHTCSVAGFSELGCLGQIDDDVKGPIAAGTNVVGKVGIDQTTPGTTNLVALTTTTNAGAAVVKGGVGVVNGGSIWNTIAASQTAQVLSATQAGGTGAVGDYISHCVIYPASTSPGVVTVFDGTNTATNDVVAFAGGASSVSNLAPIAVPVGAVSVNSGGWKVTTGANVSVACYGKFS